MRYYATLFDKNYLSRGKVMLQSLQDQTHNQSVLFVLALDQTAAELAAKWPNTRIVQIHDLEAFFPNLLEAKANRSFVSYIFTLSPFLPLYILQKHPEISRITTLDADLLFLNSPEKVLESLGDEKIGITQHGFPEEQKHKEIYGKYNVSFQSFPNTQNGLACLQSWAEDCLDFCGDYIDEKGRFADQKYLDFWSEKFHHVVDFPPTIGLAPWNLKEQQLQQTNKKWQTKEIVLEAINPNQRIQRCRDITYSLRIPYFMEVPFCRTYPRNRIPKDRKDHGIHQLDEHD